MKFQDIAIDHENSNQESVDISFKSQSTQKQIITKMNTCDRTKLIAK